MCLCLSLSVSVSLCVRLSVPVFMYGCVSASVNLLARLSVDGWGLLGWC